MRAYILFLGFVWLLIAVFLWGWRQGYNDIHKLHDFADVEQTALRRQMKALLGIPLVVGVLVLYPLAGEGARPYAFFVALMIGSGALGYIAVSSIRNRVSILRGREPVPIKGNQAVWGGVINLVVMLLFLGFILYSISSE
jgi:hypothetical protein